MKCRNILTVATLTGAALTASAMAQTTIYTCSFDNPPYTVGSIDAQQSWVTAQAQALAPGLTSMAISATAGSLAPQAGNGCFFSQNGPDATTSGRFAFQAGAGTPIVDAINTACAASATSIEFSCFVVPPTPTTSGTSLVGARHGMVLYVTDSTGVPTKAAVGFQVRAFDSQVFVVQWLDVGQLGVTTAGNYLINFTTPLTLTASTWNAVGCKWLRETGMPQVRINAGEWIDVFATSTIGYVGKEFDIVNNRGSNAGGATNTVSTVAYMDTLVITASQPFVPTDTDGDGRPDATDNCPDIANSTQADCNSDGIGDVCELAGGAPDFNQDTVPDTCQCLADLALADHQVNGADLGALLSQWGPASQNTVSDIDRDGKVGGADLGYLLNAWGPCTN
jgi:hypothetical protein